MVGNQDILIFKSTVKVPIPDANGITLRYVFNLSLVANTEEIITGLIVHIELDHFTLLKHQYGCSLKIKLFTFYMINLNKIGLYPTLSLVNNGQSQLENC